MISVESKTSSEKSPCKRYPKGVLHSYQDPVSGQRFEIRKLDIDHHLDTFHRWQNQKYVYEFWELNQPKAELKKYLENLFEQDHVLPIIGYIDGSACAYFEIYWAFYDRIAPYCDAGLYDRGFHLLIGEKRFLGRNNTILWLNLINDFIFNDDPRTERIVGEPRADNKGLLKYLEHTSFIKTKEFDFPHKRAALIECYRESFYKEVRL